ncbi:hypothetical protein JHW43_004528 [Diplocarpon mali]|nr:hypothetical protein JHW43_004528 [Diplocarpon mali]
MASNMRTRISKYALRHRCSPHSSRISEWFLAFKELLPYLIQDPSDPKLDKDFLLIMKFNIVDDPDASRTAPTTVFEYSLAGRLVDLRGDMAMRDDD